MVASADRRTLAASNPSKLTDGIRTRSSRWARTSGMSWSIFAGIAWIAVWSTAMAWKRTAEASAGLRRGGSVRSRKKGVQTAAEAAFTICVIGVSPKRALATISWSRTSDRIPETTAISTYSPDVGIPTSRSGPYPGAATT